MDFNDWIARVDFYLHKRNGRVTTDYHYIPWKYYYSENMCPMEALELVIVEGLFEFML